MPSTDDERRLEMIRKAALEAQRPLDQPRRDVFEALNLSSATVAAAKKLYAENELKTRVSELSDQPEVEAVLEENHTLLLMAKYGMAARMLRAKAELQAAAKKFMANPENSYNSDTIRRKYRKDEPGRIEYAKRYSLFPQHVDVFANVTDEQVSIWNTYQLDQPGLRTDQTLGEYLHSYAAEFKQHKRARIKLDDFATLARLFLSVIRREHATHGNEVAKSQTPSEELFIKTLYELGTARAEFAEQIMAQLPRELITVCRDGLPLVELFAVFYQQLVETIVDAEDHNHQLAIELLTELNTFQLTQLTIPAELRAQSFNYQLCHGLVHRDLLGDFNYQDFMCRLNDLANTPSANQEWYQTFQAYLVTSAEHFNYHPVYEAERITTDVFDTTAHHHIDVDLAAAIEVVLGNGGQPQFTVFSDDKIMPPGLVSLQSDRFIFTAQARRVRADHYIINNELSLIGSKQAADDADGLFHNRVSKFRYQVRVEHGNVTVHLPVIDADQLTPEVEALALYHTKLLITVVAEDITAERPDTSKKNFTYIDLNKNTQVKKPGSRTERMNAYQAEREQTGPVADTEELREHLQAISPESLEISTVEEDAVSKFLPLQIVLPSALQRDVEKRKAKGTYAELVQLADSFVTAYNQAGEAKPGRGIQLTDVYGPDGENVYRFRSSSDTRCVVVELEDGTGLLVDIDKRDEVYGGALEMRKKVARELDKYYREQGRRK